MAALFWTDQKVIDLIETLIKDYTPLNKNTWEAKEISKEPPFIKKQHGTAFLVNKYKKQILTKNEKTM